MSFSYTTNEFKTGLKVIIDKDPFIIIENEFVKPGKGQAFNRVKLRNFKNGRIIERTYKSGEKLIAADILEVTMQYLYNDERNWHFMHQETYEQYEVNSEIVADSKYWLKEQALCTIILWNDSPLEIIPPNFVELEIIDTDPGLKGDTAGNAVKPATVVTGAIVKVPLFVQVGETIKIDTRNGEYISRVKS